MNSEFLHSLVLSGPSSLGETPLSGQALKTMTAICDELSGLPPVRPRRTMRCLCQRERPGETADGRRGFWTELPRGRGTMWCYIGTGTAFGCRYLAVTDHLSHRRVFIPAPDGTAAVPGLAERDALESLLALVRERRTAVLGDVRAYNRRLFFRLPCRQRPYMRFLLPPAR